MNSGLFQVDEVKTMIAQGKELILAGDEKLLEQLPAGKWIAGTTPYFMGDEGGVCTLDKIFVNPLPDYVLNTEIKRYTQDTLSTVYADCPKNGFSLIIIPGSSDISISFAMNVNSYKDFVTKPLIGWISGTLFKDYGIIKSKVYDGTSPIGLEEEAVVIHVELPTIKKAEIKIINVFKPGDGDVIEFLEDGMSAQDIYVNGEKTNFVQYLTQNNIDTSLPLVNDIFGSIINRSFKKIDIENNKVEFFAPVSKEVQYKLAVPIGDYVETVLQQLPKECEDKIFFSCNCFMNYVNAELEGKQTGVLTGPITYGEVAYQPVNRTLVYIYIYEE